MRFSPRRKSIGPHLHALTRLSIEDYESGYSLHLSVDERQLTMLTKHSTSEILKRKTAYKFLLRPSSTMKPAEVSLRPRRENLGGDVEA